MHIPVLKKEVLQYLNPRPNENFVDCTIGEGGHTLAILEKIKPEGKVLGIEQDPELYKKLKYKVKEGYFGERLVLVNDSYVNLGEIIKRENFAEISGILFDLGLSSWHLDESGRGFTFLKNEPLIMRYGYGLESSIEQDINKVELLTAKNILNQWPKEKIEKILKEYGQEKFARKIAKAIIEEREIGPIEKTFQLVEIIKRATPVWYHYRKIHPATRTFQALRIAVNDELNNLKIALSQALKVLSKRGRLAIISFHSLEDRIIKKFFKEEAKKNSLIILTKKPIRPNSEEIKINFRSRSAKLRVALKL